MGRRRGGLVSGHEFTRAETRLALYRCHPEWSESAAGGRTQARDLRFAFSKPPIEWADAAVAWCQGTSLLVPKRGWLFIAVIPSGVSPPKADERSRGICGSHFRS